MTGRQLTMMEAFADLERATRVMCRTIWRTMLRPPIERLVRWLSR